MAKSRLDLNGENLGTMRALFSDSVMYSLEKLAKPAIDSTEANALRTSCCEGHSLRCWPCTTYVPVIYATKPWNILLAANLGGDPDSGNDRYPNHKEEKNNFGHDCIHSISRSVPDPTLSPDYYDARLADLVPIYMSRRYISSFRYEQHLHSYFPRINRSTFHVVFFFCGFRGFLRLSHSPAPFRRTFAIVVVPFMLLGPEIL